jgi:P27 family predicted phage terminase small subunit
MQMDAIEGGSGTPMEPDWESLYADIYDIAGAKEEWGIVVRELRESGMLTVSNGHAIKRLVEFRVQYERSARHVAEHGPILAATSKKAKVGQWNPHWSVMKQADEAIRSLEAELGISPTKRGRNTKVQQRGAQSPRPSDRYLKRP